MPNLSGPWKLSTVGTSQDLKKLSVCVMRMCVETREQPWVSFFRWSTLTLERWFYWHLGLTYLASLSRDLPLSIAPALGLQAPPFVPGFFTWVLCQASLHGFWGPNSGPHACIDSTLLAEPSPQLCLSVSLSVRCLSAQKHWIGLGCSSVVERMFSKKVLSLIVFIITHRKREGGSEEAGREASNL